MIRTGKRYSKPNLSRIVNGDIKTPDAPEKPDLARLDVLAAAQFPGYSRSTLQSFIKDGYVLAGSEKKLSPAEKLPKDTVLSLELPKQKTKKPKLPVIFENEFVIVVDKPTGLLSMAKGEYCNEPTLEDYGLLVHRLDRATSGVIILAKDKKTQTYLRKQFQNRKTHKTYYAIIEGKPKLNSAVIDLPLARNLKKPTTFIVSDKGRPAQTAYHVIKSNSRYSMVELHPITGRTHQLRVHLKYIKTPILGDAVYGKEGERLFLHASSLEITVPTINGNKRMIFDSPLPGEFEKIMREK